MTMSPLCRSWSAIMPLTNPDELGNMAGDNDMDAPLPLHHLPKQTKQTCSDGTTNLTDLTIKNHAKPEE